jgi:hypothetical protein
VLIKVECVNITVGLRFLYSLPLNQLCFINFSHVDPFKSVVKLASVASVVGSYF